LPPKGIASGAAPVITGVTAQGDGAIVFHGKNLMNLNLYTGDPKVGLGLWWKHGPITLGEHTYPDTGKYDLTAVKSRSDSKIVIWAGGTPFHGKVTIKAVAQDKAIHGYKKFDGEEYQSGTGGKGADISAPGLPATIQFGGVKTAAAKRPKPKGRIGRRRRR